MAGLVAYGRDIGDQATTGLQSVARMENQRKTANDQMAAQHKQDLVSNTLGGAMAGAMLGTQIGAVGGPMGMAAGALIGLAATELF